MNRIQSLETDTLFPVVVVRGALLLNGLRVKALIDHDAGEIRVSSLVPAWQRPELVRLADDIARKDVERDGAFAEVWQTDGAGGFVVDPVVYRAPHRPRVRAGVERGFNSYTVPGVLTVTGWPDRPLSAARAICRRVLRDRSYLDVLRLLDVPGVTFHKRPRRARRVA